jgi:signal transduction histidine kinase
MTSSTLTGEERAGILLVDDTEANLVALEAVLGDLGCDLVRASSGNEALRQLLRRKFAVMLLDVQMPEIDGYEVAQYARSNPQTREVPIIFLTAMHGTEAGMLRGYGSGAVDFLWKPINPTVLRSKVRVFLELHESRRKVARASAELEVANTALRHFTAAASHDLREPARTVRGFMQALLEDAGEGLDPRARHYVDRSLAASQRMLSLLDSLLLYARLHKPPVWVEVDGRTLLEQVTADLSARIAACGARLEVGPMPRLRADPDRLYQLFSNLTANALKFAGKDRPPEVRITAVREEGEGWVFTVADNGIGIAPAQQELIFEAFRRLHARTEYEGSGLGLTICKEIVEQHGGRIWVESEAGQGARFSFSLGPGCTIS